MLTMPATGRTQAPEAACAAALSFKTAGLAWAQVRLESAWARGAGEGSDVPPLSPRTLQYGPIDDLKRRPLAPSGRGVPRLMSGYACG